MKRPKSPDWLDSSRPPKSQEGQEEDIEEEDEEERKVAAVHRAKRERRQGSSSATMCRVCNIQLNSNAQAQIHYRGKTHQRRSQQKENSRHNDVIIPAVGALSQSQVHPLLGSLPLPLPCRPFQPQTHPHLEHFLPLRINSSTPLSLFPNFSTMDPVQKAVINHTFGVAPVPKKKPIISCNICHLRFNSTIQAEAHYKGHKHARKMKALETQRKRQKNDSSSLRSPQPSPQISPGTQLNDLPSDSPPVEGCSLANGSAPHSDPQGSTTGGEEEEVVKVEEAKEVKSDTKPLHCPTCKVTLNSSSQLESHCSGMVKMTSSHRPTSRIRQRMGNKTRSVVGVSSQPFHCELCQVSVNSETQLKQHMCSRRHKERLAGKPVKAKFTPYNKLQSSVILATKLALQKQLSKALPARFLTNPLNHAALCAMAPGPLALRLPPGPTAFIHGPLISPTLFRPAPGPLRATHAPFIFSPY
uniref:Zinc finger protein 385C n=1 Tax=Cyclopterus lumpus TaxID=8103 RepID=A0A8C2WND7_CYCLU